jgi:hypothetical protein
MLQPASEDVIHDALVANGVIEDWESVPDDCQGANLLMQPDLVRCPCCLEIHKVSREVAW